MKLLFDENLSGRLIDFLSGEFPHSAHVEKGLGRRRSDEEIAALLRSRLVDMQKFADAPEEALLVIESR